MNCLQYIELLILGRKLSKNTEFKFRMHIFKKFFIPGKTTTQIPDKNKKIKRYVDIYLHPLELEFENDKSVYVAALIAIFHEFHHVKQFYDIKEGTAKPQIAISLLASQNNKKFYDNNYKYLPYEIEAEMIGVMDAYRYLLKKTDNNAFQAVKNYIKSKITHEDSRYKQRGFNLSKINSIADIESIFKKNIQHSFNQELNMNPIYDAFSEEISMCDTTFQSNLIYKLLKIIGKEKIKHIFNLLESGMPQLNLIAAYVLEEHPDYSIFFNKYNIQPFSNYTEAYKKFCSEIEHNVLKNEEKRILFKELLNQLIQQ